MFKKIPQDNVTRRLFTVHKENKLTQDDVDVYQVHDATGSYDKIDTDPLVGAPQAVFLKSPVRGLYNSTKLRYYNPSGPLLESFVGFTSRQTYAKKCPPTTMSLLSFDSCLRGGISITWFIYIRR